MSGVEAVDIIAEHHIAHDVTVSSVDLSSVPACECGWVGKPSEIWKLHLRKLDDDAAHASHVVSVLAASGHTIMPTSEGAEKKAQPVRDQLDLKPNNLALLGATIPDAAFDGIRALAKRWLMKRLEEGVAGSYAIALEHCADELYAAIDMAAAAASAEEETND